MMMASIMVKKRRTSMKKEKAMPIPNITKKALPKETAAANYLLKAILAEVVLAESGAKRVSGVSQ